MHHLHAVILRFTFFILLLMNSGVASSDSLKSLLMPGKVITSHQKYEEDCEQCHDTSDKEKQGELCIQCHAHEDISADISNKKGFHGRLPTQLKTDCKHCHTEHKGREKNIVLLNLATFNHQQTDFKLKGTHKKAACSACHKSEKKYSEAPEKCIDCHKNSDVHKGKQGKKCNNCHNETNWKKTKFDHSKTDFPLKGAHKKTRCTVCHINNKYKDTPKLCINCHKINDIHTGSFGKKCNSCHNTKKWNQIKFNHNKKTDFPLYGKHKTADCNSCHTSSDLKKELPKKCYSCHKNNDEHKGRYGKKCNSCHTSSSWSKQIFNHDKKTKFSLIGKHKTTSCNQCHTGDLYKHKLKNDCYSCHKKNDVHRGKQGKKCNDCHNEKGWNNEVVFDHDLSHFPLIGMHATTQCEECHLTNDYADVKSDCNTCHAGDDVHKTRLGTNCNACHNPNSWFTWLFKHDKDTSFKLDGKHKKLGCYDCHQTKSNGKLKASKDCISCHRSRDIHNRSFGRQCGNCHNTSNFREINIKR
ncbi:MAG: cytochrome C [endosymbiont of Galathealinum brachiosum]|uniref:Cytochrome C n=1 Tax=endosymbiont of Galathealinum brachiosum TaxID=2200906 RepID=A0A370DLD9_9GAMM|nr:MAG: cytochrome C [endosymbiont of Galathealinum brachiosum]